MYEHISDFEWDVYECVRQMGTATEFDMALALSCAPTMIRHAVKRLVAAGLLAWGDGRQLAVVPEGVRG
jgi:hypothetical protein